MRKIPALFQMGEHAKIALIVLYTLCFIAGGAIYYRLYSKFMYEAGVERISGAMSAVVTGKQDLFYQYSRNKDDIVVKQELQSLFSGLFNQFPDGDLVLVDNNLNVVVNRGYWSEFAINDILTYGNMRTRILDSKEPLMMERGGVVVFAHPYLRDGVVLTTLMYVIERDQILKNIFDSGITIAMGLFFALYILGIVLIGVSVSMSVDSLKWILEGLEKVATGNFSYRASEHSKNELGALAKSYNRLAQMLHELSQKTATEAGSLRDAEMEVQKYRDYLEHLLMQRIASHDVEKGEMDERISQEREKIAAIDNALADNLMYAAAAFITKRHTQNLDLIYNVSDIAGTIVRKGMNISESQIDSYVEQFDVEAGKFMSINGSVRYLLTKNFDIFSFYTDDFCARLSEVLSNMLNDVDIAVEADDVGDSSFTGHERYYMRILVSFTAFVASALMDNRVQNPSILIKMSIVGKRLRVVIQDNRRGSGDDTGQIQISDMEDGIVYAYQMLFNRYRDTIVAKSASIGMRYTIEFSGALI